MADHVISQWLESKPGPFAGRTPAAVWGSAHENFRDFGHGCELQVEFIVRAQGAGLDVRPTGVGGFVLDSVQ